MKRTLFTLVVTFCFSLAANAATYTVTNTNDSGPGSLRAGLGSAANGDRINFIVSGTITLTSAQLVIGANVTIIGPGAGKLAISGNGEFPVFQVNSGVTAATISGVTIEDGYSNSMPGGGGINNLGTLTVSHSTLSGNFAEANESNNGGAIYNSGTLTVSNSIVSDNAAFSIGGNGGGIYNTGTLTVSYSSFPGNGVGSPGGSGADIYNTSAGTLLVSHSTMSGATCCGGAGGDIYNGGWATIGNSTLSNSQNYQGPGGAIYNSGTMTVSDSTLSGNSTDQDNGGGIFNEGALTVISSTLSDNSVSNGGGAGIYNSGTVTVIGSTFVGNSSSSSSGGGAILNEGTLSVSNSTFSGNSASSDGDGGANAGGAIYSGGTLTVSSSTLSGNSASGDGGAIYISSGTLTLKSTLLAGQGSGGNCGGAGTSLGYNLSDDSTCSFLIQTGDQNDSTTAGLSLSGLRNNGGVTQTIALLPTSSAVDVIPPGACTDALGNPIASDQRGVARPQGAGCDIGAFELVPFVSPGNLVFANVKLGQMKGQVETLTNTGETEIAIGTISFTNVSGNPADFGFRRSCSAQLAPGHSCTLAVRYRPSKAATESAMLTIVTSAPGRALQVPVTARGIP